MTLLLKVLRDSVAPAQHSTITSGGSQTHGPGWLCVPGRNMEGRMKKGHLRRVPDSLDCSAYISLAIT